MPKKYTGEQETGKTLEPGEITSSLLERLPDIAKSIIQKNLDLSKPDNKRFFENPDNPADHVPNYHQWGIITHTIMFEKFYREEVPQFLDQWGLKDKVRAKMAEEIDGITKDQLLGMAIPLHDLGKFSDRRLQRQKDGSMRNIFSDHEVASGAIIRSPKFSEILKQEYSLTPAQIEYLAKCADLHFQFGDIREEAKKSGISYTIAFARSDNFKEMARKLMAKHPDFQLEIGLLFLADSLAKTDVRIGADTDEQISAPDSSAKDLLVKRGLNPKLIDAVKQLPVNLAVVETYLKTWAQKQ